MFDETLILEDTNILIVPLSIKFANELFIISQDSEIFKYLPVEPFEKLEEVTIWIDIALNQKQQHKSYPFVIIDKNNSRVVGTTRLMQINEENKKLEIGWTWIAKNYWGHGFNKKCKKILLEYCFEKIKFNRVQFRTDENNIRSQKALENIGAIKEGILRNDMIRKDGTLRNSILYSIIRSDWEVIKQTL